MAAAREGFADEPVDWPDRKIERILERIRVGEALGRRDFGAKGAGGDAGIRRPGNSQLGKLKETR